MTSLPPPLLCTVSLQRAGVDVVVLEAESACGGRAGPRPHNGDPQQETLVPAELLLRIPAAMDTASSAASDDLVALLAAQQGLQLLPLYADGKAGQGQGRARSSASVAAVPSASVATAAAPAGPDWDSLLESSPPTRPSSAAGEGTPLSSPLTLLSAAGSGGPVHEGVAREAER